MKTSKGIARALVSTLVFALILAGLAYATRDWRSARGLTLAQFVPKKLEGDEALVKNLRTTLKAATAERAKIEATVAKLELEARSIRSELGLELKGFNEAEQAEVVEILRSNKLPAAYRERVDVARMMVKYNQGANTERTLGEQRAKLDALSAQIDRAQKEYASASNRIEVDKWLGKADAQRIESPTASDADECIDALKALTEESALTTIQELGTDGLEPSDVARSDAAEQVREDFLSSIVEEANGTYREAPIAIPSADDAVPTSVEAVPTVVDERSPSQDVGLPAIALIAALGFGAVVLIFLYGLVALFKSTTRRPESYERVYYPEAQPTPQRSNWGLGFLVFALIFGALLAGPVGAFGGLILGLVNWQWRLGVKLLGLVGFFFFAVLALGAIIVVSIGMLFI